ncbi:MAG: DNA-invertase hin [Syntrophomonadaceae bacterium]|nr:DNA-invertase hin [Bacillota bacterium]
MRVVGYVRVSTEDQAREGVSMDSQAAKIEAYCVVKDWTLFTVQRDEGLSGKSMDRPGLAVILDLVKTRKVQAVIVYKLDRLTRSVVDLNLLIGLFEKNGVALVSLQESLDASTATGRLMLNLLASVSQWEREVAGERTKVALAHLRRERRVYSRPVYGYDEYDGRLIENLDEQAIIAQMREWQTQGISHNAIATRLNKLRMPTKRGGRWYDSTVKQILAAREVV